MKRGREESGGGSRRGQQFNGGRPAISRLRVFIKARTKRALVDGVPAKVTETYYQDGS
jgi:hypothetical protein